MKFMNLPDEFSNENCEFVILPIEYEGNVTYGKGASKGSEEILKASKQLEYYDEQFDVEGFEKGIMVLEPLKLNNEKPEDAINQIFDKVKKLKDKFVIGLGGDHSVTIGTVKGLAENNDFSVVIFDAHSDMFHSWNGSEYNHRCVAKKISKDHKTLLIGVRSMDADEAEIIRESKNVDIIKAYEYDINKLKERLNKLENKVFISIDVDVFDPSFVRNTGTPEPGGFFWEEMINVLAIIFKEKNVIGFDLVEFAPEQNFRAESYSLTKLVYKMINMKVKFE